MDRYIEGNRIVSFATVDDTKTIEEYVAEHKRITRECLQLRSEKTGLHDMLVERDEKIKALNSLVAKLKEANLKLVAEIEKNKPGIVQEEKNRPISKNETDLNFTVHAKDKK